MTTNQPTSLADLEKNGILFALAEACCQALREAAETATPRRFLYLVGHQVADAGQELTTGHVAAHLQTTMVALQATKLELFWAENAGRA